MFEAWYLGSLRLGPSHSAAMVPWMVARHFQTAPSEDLQQSLYKGLYQLPSKSDPRFPRPASSRSYLESKTKTTSKDVTSEKLDANGNGIASSRVDPTQESPGATKEASSNDSETNLGKEQKVILSLDRELKVIDSKDGDIILCLELSSELTAVITRMRDALCLALLLRGSQCHIFRLPSENKVRELERVLRQAVENKFVRRSDNLFREGGDQYEVFYVGRIKTNAERPNGPFLDQSVERFHRLLDPSSPKPSGLLQRLGAEGASLRRKLFQKSNSTDQPSPPPLESPILSKSLSSLPQAIASGLPAAMDLQSRLRTKLKLTIARKMSGFDSNPSESSPEDLTPAAYSAPPLPLIHLRQRSRSYNFESKENIPLPNGRRFSDDSLLGQNLNNTSKKPPLPLLDRRFLKVGFQEKMPKDDEVFLPSDRLNSRPPTGLSTIQMRRHSGLTNRTMLFIVGKLDIFLLCPDRKQPLLTKSFSEISHCTQGLKYPDHFGIVSREVAFGGEESHVAHVFRCQTRDVVDDLMQTVKQAFQTANKELERVKQSDGAEETCDGCPLLWYHRLCQDIEDLPEDKAHLIILHRISSMSIPDQAWLMANTSKSAGVRDQNDRLMTLLLEMCEKRQLDHVHTSSQASPWPGVIKAVLDTQAAAPLKNIIEKIGAPNQEMKTWKSLFLDTLSLSPPEPPSNVKGQRSSHALKGLWKKAVMEQMLVAEMEKSSPMEEYPEKILDYDELTPTGNKDHWCQILIFPPKDRTILRQAVRDGIPRALRGDVWRLLTPKSENPVHYRELLQGLTPHQHAILIDLGRTFPKHPHFSHALGAGQLSLFNILKAYSLFDPGVGYCQGLSFLAAVLLLHMSESHAFRVLTHLMSGVGLREQYTQDMAGLHVQMFQLARLIQDRCLLLYNHFKDLKILPGMFASSWFLTVYSTDFPLGFSARILDLIFLDGREILFRAALSLLKHHAAQLLKMDNLENVVEFLKKSVASSPALPQVLTDCITMDLSEVLQQYEEDYYLLDRPHCSDLYGE